MRRRAAALVLVLLAFACPAAADEESPREVVEKLHARLVQVAARAESLGHAGRVLELQQVVRDTHAFDLIARERIASHWGTRSVAQRTKLADLVGRLTVAAYAKRQAKSERLRYEARGAQGYEKGVWFVPATRTAADGGRREIVYRVQQVGATWRIVNRVEGGKDPVPGERKEYAAFWARGGYPALIAGLEAKLKPKAQPAPAATATQVVAKLQDTLLSVMRQAKQLRYAGRHRRLDPVVRETHYLPAIARLTVRRYWSKWSAAQQKEFANTFARLSVANYASKFDGYSGEQFARIGEKQVGKSTVVQSVLTKSNGEKIRFDYTMRRVTGRWRILNITVDGVSDLSTKQAEYGSVLTSGGLPALLQKLKAQIRRYETE